MVSSGPATLLDTGAHLTGRALFCRRGERSLFDGLDLDVGPGEVLQVEGANGSGKTHLLRALCGLVPLEAGAVYWGGLEIGEAAESYRAMLAYVGHVPGIKHDLTPAENLETARAVAQAPPGEPIASALSRLGLLGHEDTPLRRLSAGQCRRVALARLLVTPAPLWILDEPFTALDAGGRELVTEIIGEHCMAGGMAVVATHTRVALDATPIRNLRMGA